MKYAMTDEKKIATLLQAANVLSPLHWAIAYILLETGCHIEVITKLSKSNIQEDVLEWRRPKTKRMCFARLTPTLMKAVEILHKHRGKSRQWYYILFKEAAKKAGMPTLSPLSLRKTFCYRKLREKYPETVISQMMGCGVDLIRSTYSQIAPEDLKKIILEGKMPQDLEEEMLW